MNQEALDRFKDLIDSSPRCKCGGNCELLEDLAAKLLDIQVDEIGFELPCPSCNKPLLFDSTSPLGLYRCEQCDKWFSYNIGTNPVEIKTKPTSESLTDYQ